MKKRNIAKKFISLALGLVLMLGLAVPVLAEEYFEIGMLESVTISIPIDHHDGNDWREVDWEITLTNVGDIVLMNVDMSAVHEWEPRSAPVLDTIHTIYFFPGATITSNIDTFAHSWFWDFENLDEDGNETRVDIIGRIYTGVPADLSSLMDGEDVFIFNNIWFRAATQGDTVWRSLATSTFFADRVMPIQNFAVGTISTPPAPSTDNNLYTASDWAQEGITNAIYAGLVPASLQNSYTNNTTRAEFTALAVALYETVTGREITGRMHFNDTNDINVQKMGYLGIVTGVGGGNFAPNSTLTREQAAVMLARLAEVIGQPLPPSAPTFADNAQISSWAADGVGQMQASGIMGGVGNNQFSPSGDYTREQSIVTILRLFDMLQ